MPTFTVTEETWFSAAHALHGFDMCERMHGHNYKVKVFVTTEKLDDLGTVVDFVALRKAIDLVVSPLDHRDLNTVPPFDTLSPTAEHIARHIADQIAAQINDGRARVTQVEVWETPTSCAIYER